MPRKPAVDPAVPLQIWLPRSELTRLELTLYSELEGRIPHGRRSEFFRERLREFFGSRRLDLSGFGFAPGSLISGPKLVIDELERKLTNA